MPADKRVEDAEETCRKQKKTADGHLVEGRRLKGQEDTKTTAEDSLILFLLFLLF